MYFPQTQTPLRAEMQAAGVFHSLARLGGGTSWEREIGPTLTSVRTNIPGTIEYKAVAMVDEMLDKLGIRRSHFSTNHYTFARKQRRLDYASARTHSMENKKRK
ncbi:hypothetical protein KY331_00720 [Candidatus Woesearchaeota archaeon]|nr:hypothetical protein [Candidatus Woesearchaeota archaeon]